MKRNVWTIMALTVIFLLASSSALALGPVDVEVKVMYWLGEESDSALGMTFAESDMDGVGVEVDLWLIEKLGISLDYYPTSGYSDLFGTDIDIDYVSLDIKWRVFSPTEHNYLALGAGWQDTEESIEGESLSTSGVRLLVEGNFGIVGVLQGYAHYVYLPDLSDVEPGGIPLFTDGDGSEYELGVQLKFGIVGIYAGYRAHKMNFDVEGIRLNMDNEGFIAGVGFEF